MVNTLFSEFVALNVASDKPEKGMQPEKGENGDQQARHDHVGPVQDRIVSLVSMFCVGHVEDKISVGTFMTLATGFLKTFS